MSHFIKDLKFFAILLLLCSQAHGIEHLDLNDDVVCIGSTIFHEARGEITAAEMVVAQLIVKRVEDPRHPDNACDVVKYKGFSKKYNKWICAFEWYCNFNGIVDIRNVHEKKAWEQALSLAEKYLSPEPPVIQGFENVTLMHDTSISNPWKSATKVGRVGRLIFYSE